MGIYNDLDISVSASGDLTIQANGDFKTVVGSSVLKQDITFRVRSNPGDFYPHPELGAGLDEIIGEPNDRNTCAIGERKIAHSLTNDGMIKSIDLAVKGVPIALDQVVYYLFVNNGAGQVNVTPEIAFNTNTGFSTL
jgi:hypothetical protein